MRSRFLVVFAYCIASGLPALVHAADSLPAGVVAKLNRGELANAEQQLQTHLKEMAADDNARFALGLVQILRTFERFAQFQWEHGVKARDLSLQLKPNPRPQELDYARWRGTLENMQRDLSAADATLAKIRNDKIRVTLELGKLRWDLDGDGSAEELLSLTAVVDRKIILGLGLNLSEISERNPNFTVTFDRADAHSLQASCQVLLGLSELTLALDGQTLFDMFSQFAYEKPIFSPKIAAMSAAERAVYTWPDAHELQFVEPKRWQKARKHFVAAAELSIATLDAAERETDDDFEWVPNSKQVGAMAVANTPGMAAAWREAIQETQAVLEGKKLVPLQVNSRKGFDLHQFLDEPPKSLHILMLQGIYLSRYIKEGERAKGNIYSQAAEYFGAGLTGFR